MGSYAAYQAQDIALLDKPKIGINGNNNLFTYINTIKSQRPWTDSAGTSIASEYLDPDTKELASIPPVTPVRYLIEVLTRSEVGATSLDVRDADGEGAYTLTWDGTATVTLSGNSSTRTITDSGSNYIKYTVHTYSNMTATFSGLDSEDLPRNVANVRDEHLALHAAGTLFNPDFVDKFRGFACIRNLDLQNTNDSNESAWSTRASTDWIYHPRMPYEHQIALANEVGADLWLNVPHKADNDYIDNLAALCRDTLVGYAHPEYSNETWNYNFDQTNDLITDGEAYFGSSGGTEYISYNMLKAVRMIRRWERVYGDNRKWKAVLAYGRGQYTTEIFNASFWAASGDGDFIEPYKVFDVLATNGYFGNGIPDDPDLWPTLRDSGQAAAVALMEAEIPAKVAANSFTTYAAAAETYGMSFELYEVNHHLVLNQSFSKNFFQVFTCPSGEAADFTIGNTVTQTGTGYTGTVHDIQGNDLWIDGDAIGNWSLGVLTESGTGVSTDPTGIARYNPKTGMIDLMEAAAYGDVVAEGVTDNLDNFFGEGGAIATHYMGLGISTRFNSWGAYRGISETSNPVIDGLLAYRSANPRTTPKGGHRTVPWPTIAYGVDVGGDEDTAPVDDLATFSLDLSGANEAQTLVLAVVTRDADGDATVADGSVIVNGNTAKRRAFQTDQIDTDHSTVSIHTYDLQKADIGASVEITVQIEGATLTHAAIEGFTVWNAETFTETEFGAISTDPSVDVPIPNGGIIVAALTNDNTMTGTDYTATSLDALDRGDVIGATDTWFAVGHDTSVRAASGTDVTVSFTGGETSAGNVSAAGVALVIS